MIQEQTVGHLIMIAAPSGAGKTSLVKALIQRNPEDITVSVSYTTRPQREGEIDGKSYHFITREEFQARIADNHFIEYASVFNHLYGTSRNWLEKNLRDGKHVILEIDWQGAEQIRTIFNNNLSIFILPPSYRILEQRLRDRGNDSEEVIVHRMQTALDEISHFNEFDQVIINDNFEHALQKLEAITEEGPQESLKPDVFSDFVAQLVGQGPSSPH